MHAPQNATAPSPLQDHLGFWLRLVSNQVSSRFQQLLETQAGCSVAEWVALRVLFDRPGTTHVELIQALGMTKGATSKIVSRLEKRGLARHKLAAGRHREQVITLTPTGMKLVPRLAAHADENDAHFFGHLTTREHKALMNACISLAGHHHMQGPPVD